MEHWFPWACGMVIALICAYVRLLIVRIDEKLAQRSEEFKSLHQDGLLHTLRDMVSERRAKQFLADKRK